MQALVQQLIERHRPGVLLVTHDVDEAIALADRALVMRDGAIAGEYAVPTAARTRRKGVITKRLRPVFRYRTMSSTVQPPRPNRASPVRFGAIQPCNG